MKRQAPCGCPGPAPPLPPPTPRRRWLLAGRPACTATAPAAASRPGPAARGLQRSSRFQGAAHTESTTVLHKAGRFCRGRTREESVGCCRA